MNPNHAPYPRPQAHPAHPQIARTHDLPPGRTALVSMFPLRLDEPIARHPGAGRSSPVAQNADTMSSDK